MAKKTRLGARVDSEVLDLARARAEDLGLSIGDYISRLVREDAGQLRARGLEAARRFLDEYRTALDEAEEAGLAAARESVA
ncbi:hypothetical protein ACFP1Z_11505 [Streptomyces gamaensis]|uniref:Toxin-antitoxin system HicB family antitoxin n=1 Tax=Streptomyces gamaensis TaxID=1763542 RepID=A0ABW0YWA7_9ACTN